MKSQPKKVLAISGSVRRNSVNRMILEFIKESQKDILDIDIWEDIEQLPYFNPDQLDSLPVPVHAFYDRIAKADGLIICSPEYVFSIPGVLKNALEWTVSTVLFAGKPLALIVASSLGEKTFESLDLVMTTLGAKMTADTKLLISGSNSKIDKVSHALSDRLVKDLDHLTAAFIRLIP